MDIVAIAVAILMAICLIGPASLIYIFESRRLEIEKKRKKELNDSFLKLEGEFGKLYEFCNTSDASFLKLEAAYKKFCRVYNTPDNKTSTDKPSR